MKIIHWIGQLLHPTSLPDMDVVEVKQILNSKKYLGCKWLITQSTDDSFSFYGTTEGSEIKVLRITQSQATRAAARLRAKSQRG